MCKTVYILNVTNCKVHSANLNMRYIRINHFVIIVTIIVVIIIVITIVNFRKLIILIILIIIIIYFIVIIIVIIIIIIAIIISFINITIIILITGNIIGITIDLSFIIYFQYGPFPAPGNPNTVSEQDASYTIPKVPTEAAEPACLNMGAIGVAKNGIPLFNPYSAEG